MEPLYRYGISASAELGPGLSTVTDQTPTIVAKLAQSVAVILASSVAIAARERYRSGWPT